MMFAEVLINIKISGLNRSFTYAVPEEYDVSVGSVVSVPFGHQNQKGIVISLTEQIPDYDVKSITDVINESFVFPTDLLNLAGDLSEYYGEPMVSYLSGMIPRGVNLFGKAMAAKTIELFTPLPLNASVIRGKKQKELYDILLEHKELSRKEISDMGFSAAVISGLKNNGLIESKRVPLNRYFQPSLDSNAAPSVNLTQDQKKALDKIHNRSKTDNRPILLHGVTGSGKTEVYLRLIEDTLKKGKQSIVLLPEVSLTPQFISIFENRFPDQTAVFHYRRTAGQRRDAWFAFRNGDAKIALGARSCIFAPGKNIGLIIIDEEHESAYEQENSPRFHAVKVAEFRSYATGATLLLGSATPSMESFQKALQGEYMLVSMLKRVHDTPLPEVTVVDMRKELSEGWHHVLSRRLLDEISLHLKQHKQVILYLNRLGYHTFISCRDCGFVYTCPDCGVSLSWYEKEQKLKCNRCDYSLDHGDTCPECGSKRIKYFGLGSEKLEVLVRELFPDAVVDRFDSETTKNKDNLDDIYMRMRTGKTQILIGTQMVAKGWDFPDVGLTGIIAADYMLNFPDFRCSEQTFRMICQVAGRSGRGREKGRVILQTYRPEDITLQLACSQNYIAYYQYEIKNRELYHYPPFVHLVKVIIILPLDTMNPDLRKFIQKAMLLFSDSCRVFGPSPAVYREKGKEKFIITFLGENLELLKASARKFMEYFKNNNSVINEYRMIMEVNPMHVD